MTPLILAGAALLGGYAIAQATHSDAPSRASRASSRSASEAQAVAQPQSYLVTPVSGGAQASQGVSVVDAVRKFTV